MHIAPIGAHTRLQRDTEHGQEWLTCLDCGAQWSDTEPLEQVTQGDGSCDELAAHSGASSGPDPDGDSGPMINILSIDAWADGDDGWTWNAWHKVGTCPLSLCDQSGLAIILYMVREAYLLPDAAHTVAVEDDQYNMVIIDKETGEPLFALEYGPAND